MHDSQLQAVSFEVPNVKLVFSAFTSINPSFYWSLTSEMPDLEPKRRTQLQVIVNAGLQGGVPWLKNSCKSVHYGPSLEKISHFFFTISNKFLF